jgi:hypothetical protein
MAAPTGRFKVKKQKDTNKVPVRGGERLYQASPKYYCKHFVRLKSEK